MRTSLKRLTTNASGATRPWPSPFQKPGTLPNGSGRGWGAQAASDASRRIATASRARRAGASPGRRRPGTAPSSIETVRPMASPCSGACASGRAAIVSEGADARKRAVGRRLRERLGRPFQRALDRAQRTGAREEAALATAPAPPALAERGVEALVVLGAGDAAMIV